MQFITGRLSKPTLAFDFSLLMLGQAGAQLAGALAGLVIVRALPPSEYGRYALALTTVGLAGVVVDFGLNAILAREVARQPADAPGLLADASLLRLLVSAVALGLAAALGALWPALGEPLLILLGGLALAPRGFLRALSSAWLGLRRAGRAALLDGGVGLLAPLAAALAALLTDRAGAALLAASLATALVAWLALRSDASGLRPGRPLPGRWRRLLAGGGPLMLAGLAGAGFHALDLYVVGWLVGLDAVPAYAAPFRILSLAMLPPTVWGVAALPRFAALKDDLVALRRVTLVWLPRLGAAGLAVCVAVSVAAPLVTGLLLGPSYSASASTLALLIWMSFFVYLSAPLIALLTALDRQAGIAGAVLMAGLTALALNVWLAPRLGVMGVAAVKVGAMGLLLGLYALLTRLALRRQALREVLPDALRGTWAAGWGALWRGLVLLAIVVLAWARREPLPVGSLASLDYPFEAYAPNAWLSSAVALAALLAYLLAGAPGWRRVGRQETRLLVGASLGLAAWGWLSLSWAARPALGLLPAARLTLGVLVMLALLASPLRGRAVALAMAAGVAFQAAVALPQFILQRDLGLRGLGELALRAEWSGVSVVTADGLRWLRAYGLSVHPNVLGGFLAVGLLFALAGYTRAGGARRAAWGAVVLAGLAAWLVAFSRGAWLALGVGGLVTVGCWLVAGRASRSRLLSWAALGAAALALVAGFGIRYRPLVTQRLGLAEEAEPVELRSGSDRAAYDALAAQVTRRHWLTGAGLANMVVAVEALLQDDWRALDPQPVHRVPSLVLAELGLPGLALWMLALLGALRAAWERWPPGLVGGAALGGLAVMVTVGLFDHYPWTIPPASLLWWLLMGFVGTMQSSDE